jgi:PAS domain S-box-containing protein
MRQFSLIKKFSILLFVALSVFGFVLGNIITSAMKQNMLDRSNEVAANFLTYEIKNKLNIEELSTPKTGKEYEEFSKHISGFNLGPDVMRIKIWNRDFTIVWSSDEEEVGEESPGHHELVEVYEGRLISEISSGHHLNEKYAYANTNVAKTVMELYIPVRFGPQDDVQLVFEVYRNVDNLLNDIYRHNRIVWGSTVTGTFLLYFLLFGLIWGASRQIDQKSAEIRVSEERFRSLIHSAQDGIISADRNGKIFLVNRLAEEIFGYSSIEVKELLFTDLFKHEEQSEFLKEVSCYFDGGECLSEGKTFEPIGLHKNGQSIPLEVSLSVSGEEENQVLTGMIRDITSHKEMLEQIAKGKREWEETFDTINDAITIHDNDFNIIRANQAAEEMLGVSLEKMVMHKCFRAYHGMDEPPVQCPSCMTAKTGIESTTEIYEPHLEKYLEIKALPRYGENKDLIGVVHVVRDITGRRKAEEKHEKLQAQLNQVQKMETVGRLAGGVAHDFNNILSVIIGYSELSLNGLPEDSQLFEDITTIKESGEKAAVLTGQLLAFSRKQVLKMLPVDLNAVIENMAKMVHRLIGEDINLDLHLIPDVGKINADTGQIEQIILNLAVNARDAMPNGGHLIIETSQVDLGNDYVDQHPDAKPGKHVLLAVTDTGSGMTDEVKKQIFDPFFTTKEMGKGTGLGLATVYGIVKQHESQIYVYSEVGKGTTFKIFLPVIEGTAGEKADKPIETIPQGKETFLIAEDDPTIQRMLKSCLEPLGYNLLIASDGKEAIDISNNFEGDIHLLLTDVIMPNMNGQELADAIQEMRPDMQIIFMSGYTDDVISHHGVLEPGVNFIQKPVTPSRLTKVLKEVLRKS